MTKNISKFIKENTPLVIALIIFYLVLGIITSISFINNNHNLVYSLDDAYIHMAIAKNFSQSGVWGIHKYNFTSSSSSILWTLILSLIYFIFGLYELVPFILNVLFSTLIIIQTYYIFKKHEINSTFLTLILLAIIFFTPLPTLVFNGLEHTMQIFIILFFSYYSALNLSNDNTQLKKNFFALLILAPFVTLTRYEGLFLIFSVSFLFLLKKKILESIYIFLSGIFSISIYGFISFLKGWYFLPNSVILKGNTYDISVKTFYNLFFNFTKTIETTPHVLVLFILSLFVLLLLFNSKKTIWNISSILLTLFLFNTIQHMIFARTDWFFRYEAYLVSFGLFALAIAIQELIPKFLSFNKKLVQQNLINILIIIFLTLPLIKRAISSLVKTPQATNNIYEQQYQMALFLKNFYQNTVIAANDIGAINYLADILCIDLWGLANIDIAKLKKSNNYNTNKIHELTTIKKAKIAIVYDHWFYNYGGLPSSWKKIAEWKIKNNVVCGGDTVSFYAIDASETKNLLENLKNFSTYLPKDVSTNFFSP
jgi:hypothetical protein